MEKLTSWRSSKKSEIFLEKLAFGGDVKFGGWEMSQDVVAEKKKTLEEIKREEINIVYDLARERKREMLALMEFPRQSVYEEVKYEVGR